MNVVLLASMILPNLQHLAKGLMHLATSVCHAVALASVMVNEGSEAARVDNG